MSRVIRGASFDAVERQKQTEEEEKMHPTLPTDAILFPVPNRER